MIEICAKILYQVELCRGNLDIMWGFSVEAELVENNERQDELCCYVSRVEERSVAITNGNVSFKYRMFFHVIKIISNKREGGISILIRISIFVAPGIIKGDEIMVINGAIVSDLDMMFLESVLQEEISLCMMMRSARTGKYVLCHNKLSRGNHKYSPL